MTHLGKRVAVHGTFATCPRCKEGGPALNNCEPAFTIMGKTVLVEGARVYCKCASKPYVIASQKTFTIEVGSIEQTSANDLSGEHMLPESRQKLVDTSTDSLGDDADRICPNMSNAEFQAHIMRLKPLARLRQGKSNCRDGIPPISNGSDSGSGPPRPRRVMRLLRACSG
ncbi:hypothetical protein [Cupriavidus taiwanensis]|uniref:hypothetical protein n=1 Tax=Cupriavidus taiwanensis TaxID=164546 RepID=UPI0034CDF51B